MKDAVAYSEFLESSWTWVSPSVCSQPALQLSMPQTAQKNFYLLPILSNLILLLIQTYDMLSHLILIMGTQEVG